VRHAICGIPLVLDEEAKDKQIIWAREVIAIDDGKEAQCEFHFNNCGGSHSLPLVQK